VVLQSIVMHARDGELVEDGSWVYVWLRPADERRVVYVGGTGLAPATRAWLHLHHDDPEIGRIRSAFRAVYQRMVDAGMQFGTETPLPTIRFEDLALTSTRSADDVGVRVQVLRRQPDGSWQRIIDRPEVAQS
jgi:hypothetical protein